MTNDETRVFMSAEAQLLYADWADSCIISGYRGGAPRIVMPRPDGPVPRTKGQVSDRAARELVVLRISESILRQLGDA